VEVSAATVVSMNLWAFGHDMMAEIEARFESFLSASLKENPLKCEYYLPSVANSLLEEKKAAIKVLRTPEQWFGITYPRDITAVREAIARLRANGVYPEALWE
jgi:hypothetical protein